MHYIIDRFEETLAICEIENRDTITIPRTDPPAPIQEGDVLVLQDGTWELDTEATDERRRRIQKKMMDLSEWIDKLKIVKIIPQLYNNNIHRFQEECGSSVQPVSGLALVYSENTRLLVDILKQQKG